MNEQEKQELAVIEKNIQIQPLDAFINQVALGTDMLTGIKTISTPAELTPAVDLLKKGKTLCAMVDNKVEEICRPLKDRKKEIDDLQRQIKERAAEVTLPIRDAIAALEGKIVTYQKQAAEEERKVREENARIAREAYEKQLAAERAAKEENPEAVTAPAESMVIQQEAVPVAPKVSGMTEIWKYRIIDVSKIPAEYMTPDTAMITKAVKGGAREIPGIEIYSESIIRR